MTASTPRLSGIVVHWHNERALEALCRSWPDDPRFELLIVDNGSTRTIDLDHGERLDPGMNLGFAGGVNYGVARAKASSVLVLNPDIVLEPGALDALVAGLEAHPKAAGLAPRLVAPDGTAQWRWQLQRLPRGVELALEPLDPARRRAARREPSAGTPVEQPAAAALALRRDRLLEVGGFDTAFFPAWFEDVDLAQRLRAAGLQILYWPEARFRHELGGCVPSLGYRRFLWIYEHNRLLFLRRHHGRGLAALGTLSLAVSVFVRLLLLPFRVPRRATGRSDAAAALWALWLATLSGWRSPRDLADLIAVRQ